jgi:hypothetical protein
MEKAEGEFMKIEDFQYDPSSPITLNDQLTLYFNMVVSVLSDESRSCIQGFNVAQKNEGDPYSFAVFFENKGQLWMTSLSEFCHPTSAGNIVLVA